ncbi:MAG TPA: tetratricopeptide repeat protein, partial [Pyrinomonadaceae bacterium]|nr:tetratricopeptide repeat protein [Pyrinomonadaceae bacterium]
ISHAVDVSLFGMNAGAHHLLNVLLHLINSLLVFAVFRKMTGRLWASLIIAALFAVHPTHVESVAWIAERKDVLSAMFWLLTMWVYVRFVRKSDAEKEKRREGGRKTVIAGENIKGWTNSFSTFLLFSASYLIVVVLFALGLMAKPMLVTLPCVLLLCDLWPLGRLRNVKDALPLIVEKLPLFAISIASSVVTFFAQHSQGAVQSLDALPITTRFVNAIVAYGKYIVMFVYPADLAVWYPYENDVPNWEISGSVLLLIGLTGLCVWQIKKRPFLLFGWLWFLGTLVPVIGIVQVGSQGLADRYTYIPFIGLFIMAVWGASSFVEDRGLSRILYEGAALVAIIALTIFANRQVSHWQNNETLYRHALAVTTNNYLISHNLCHDLMLQGRLAEAEPLCQRAVDISPDYAEAFNTLGVVQLQQGKYPEAEKNFSEAIKYAPDYAYGWLNLAHSEALQRRPDEADTNLQKAIELSGNANDVVFADTLYDLGVAYLEKRIMNGQLKTSVAC